MQNTPDSMESVSKSSLSFSAGTLLSRMSGLARDMAMAAFFGSHPAIAAFMMAFRFANLIRRLFGEGPLPASFIPHFERVKGESLEKGLQFFRDFFYTLVCFLSGLILCAEVVLFCFLQWGGLSVDNAQILYLTMLMLPGVLFICLFGLSGGLLQCERRYFMTGFAPAAFNCIWIIAVIALRGKDPTFAVIPLSVAIVIAFFMQWVMVAPRTFSLLRGAALRPQFFSTEVRRLLKPFLLAIVGVAAMQVNSTLDALFARFASLEGPAYLWYAIRIQQLPLALFGIALSAALLPPLSRALKAGDTAHYLHLLRFAFRRSFTLIFPCAAGIFVLGVSGINLLYGHASFSHEATYQTTLCLWGYGFGLLPSVFVLLLAPAFYAHQDYRVPTMGSVAAVVLNVLFTGFFIFVLKWGAVSTAVTTSLFAWFNYFYLFYFLSRKTEGQLLDAPTRLSFIKVGSATCVAALLTLLCGYFFLNDPTLSMILGERDIVFPREFSSQLIALGMQSFFFGAFFLLFARLFKADDVRECLRKF